MVAWGTIRTFIQQLLSIFVLLFWTYICRGYLDQSGSRFSYFFQKNICNLFMDHSNARAAQWPNSPIITYLRMPIIWIRFSPKRLSEYPEEEEVGKASLYLGNQGQLGILNVCPILQFNLFLMGAGDRTEHSPILHMSACESFSIKLLTMNRSDCYICYWLVDNRNSQQADLSMILG